MVRWYTVMMVRWYDGLPSRWYDGKMVLISARTISYSPTFSRMCAGTYAHGHRYMQTHADACAQRSKLISRDITLQCFVLSECYILLRKLRKI